MYCQLCIIQMHNYKGQLRRDNQPDHTPTKSSWDKQREQLQPTKYEHPPQDNRPIKQQDKYQTKYQTKYQPRYDTKYDKSQLSYYQSQGSRVVYDYDRSEKPSTRSQAYLPDQKYLFNEVIPVKIKSFEREQYEQRIRLQIQMRTEKSYSLLTILLTDDINPRFLWMFAIKQGDFMNLKHQQKLKVSYSGFPDMLKECFKQCQNEYQNEQKNNHLALQIRKGGQGKLSVLQSNRYKQSTHLELQFKLANDEQLKQHLSNKYITASEQLTKAKGLISNLENTLSQRNYEFERLNAQSNEYKRDGDKRIEQLKFEQKKKLNQLQNKYRDQMVKIKRESQLELKELKQKMSSENDALTKTKTDLTNKLFQAKQRITNLEANERQQNTKITRLDQDVTKYLRDYQIIKTQNKQLSDRRFQNQKTITELSCKIESLRSELEDKKTIITSTVQLKETNSSQISSLQAQNSEQRKQIVKLQTKITQLEGQNSKLTSTNAQLLEKISRQKQKLSQRGEIIKEQEKEIKQLKKNQLNLSRENEELQYRNNDKDNKIKNLQELLDNMQQKLQDQTKLVMALQKSLNERPALRTTSNYTGSYQPTLPYSGVNRELPSQLSNNSNVSMSRVTTNLNNPPAARTDKYEPNIRRYEQRSKSPIPKRLTQQRDPDQQQSGKAPSFQQPRPIKFKMSQPNREEQRS